MLKRKQLDNTEGPDRKEKFLGTLYEMDFFDLIGRCFLKMNLTVPGSAVSTEELIGKQDLQ